MPQFKEQYLVTFDIQKEGGHSRTENIFVIISTDMPEKCNHNIAAEMAQEKFPGCIVKKRWCIARKSLPLENPYYSSSCIIFLHNLCYFGLLTLTFVVEMV